MIRNRRLYIPIYAKGLALASLPSHRNDRTMRESDLWIQQKDVFVYDFYNTNWAIIFPK